MDQFRVTLGDVCKRPAVFVGDKNFDNAAAFLAGYDYALSKVRPDLKDTGLAGFTEWLAPRFNACIHYAWQGIIRDLNPDPDKYGSLVRLYEEFYQDRNTRGLQAIRKDYEEYDRKRWELARTHAGT